METNQTTLSLIDRLNNWIQESIMVKLTSIGFLLLILLIPVTWISDLINERQYRANDVMNEVAASWSGSQTVAGPVLVIPYKKIEKIDRGKEGVEVIERTERAYFLPENLDITGNIDPNKLKRGIFDAVVYNSNLQLKSTFGFPDFKSLNIPEDLVYWQDAYLAFGISDLRGISDNPVFKVGGKDVATGPSSNLGITSTTEQNVNVDYSTNETTSTTHYTSSGIIARLAWNTKEDFKSDVIISLPLKGSKRLDFVPVGKTTTVNLAGAWGDPSFDGEFLPAERTIDQNGFTATWKVLHYNRPFAQQWVERNQHLGGSAFGVKLLIPVDQYLKSMRSAKYGVLIILLTFVALFMVEITQKIRIHPFQYILIGAALTIYYTLLISFSEHFGYNVAYVISSVATVILISLYAMSFLKSTRLTLLLTTLLIIFYSFIFVIIQEQDYSLLLGSIGLFIIIGMLMFFSRKINWYKEKHNEAINVL